MLRAGVLEWIAQIDEKSDFYLQEAMVVCISE
jgi:hypothetical protein